MGSSWFRANALDNRSRWSPSFSSRSSRARIRFSKSPPPLTNRRRPAGPGSTPRQPLRGPTPVLPTGLSIPCMNERPSLIPEKAALAQSLQPSPGQPSQHFFAFAQSLHGFPWAHLGQGVPAAMTGPAMTAGTTLDTVASVGVEASPITGEVPTATAEVAVAQGARPLGFSSGHEFAGVTSQPVIATAIASAKPDADNPGFVLPVITIVSLLPNRAARPVVIPMPPTGKERLSIAR